METIYEDNGKVVIDKPRKGKSHLIKVYLDMRMGMTWPTATNPGYACIVGVLDEPHPVYGIKPLELLGEVEEKDTKRYFETVAASAKHFCCDKLLADTSDEHVNMVISFTRFVRKNRTPNIRLINAKDFTGFEAARSIIERYNNKKHNAFYIRPHRNPIIAKDLKTFDARDLKGKPEEKYYALHALNHVLTSYNLYPWRKPVRDQKSVLPENWEGYGEAV